MGIRFYLVFCYDCAVLQARKNSIARLHGVARRCPALPGVARRCPVLPGVVRRCPALPGRGAGQRRKKTALPGATQSPGDFSKPAPESCHLHCSSIACLLCISFPTRLHKCVLKSHLATSRSTLFKYLCLSYCSDVLIKTLLNSCLKQKQDNISITNLIC